MQPKPSIVKKCTALLLSCAAASFPKLRQVHAFSIRHGVPLKNPDFCKHLIFTAVSLSGAAAMSYAQAIFDGIENPNVFTWNTMIRMYAESENPGSALALHRRMVAEAVAPDTHTYPFLLKAVAKAVDVKAGEKLHGVLVRNGFASLCFVGNALVHYYAVCGLEESARKVFDFMRERDLVAWNAMINGYALNGRPNEALERIKEMDVQPDGFTMVSLLTACAELGALALGRRAHVYMIKTGLDGNLHAANALLDLYAKCGFVWDARRVFDEMEERSVVSWSSLVVGLAVNGFGELALELFGRLEEEGMRPSEVAFVGVLHACSHCGMVDEAFMYFERMEKEFGVVPKIEHYGCMVDLLGRAGLVKRAFEYIESMPMPANAVIWRMLLGACTIHGHVSLGEYAREKIRMLEPNHCGDYVLLSNLYASERRWGDCHRVRRTMLKEGIKKVPGHSVVELGNCMHEFVMGDRSHPQTKAIYAKLAEMSRLLALEGYMPHTVNVLSDIENEEKETALSYHSEKIAIAFMLINTPPGSPIRVVKNLRICADCHLAIKLVSKIYQRDIIVRDRSRFHHFRDGMCSCRDYW